LIYGCYDPLMSRGVYTACPAFNRPYRELLGKDRVLNTIVAQPAVAGDGMEDGSEPGNGVRDQGRD
jgi:hypothetical protein